MERKRPKQKAAPEDKDYYVLEFPDGSWGTTPFGYLVVCSKEKARYVLESPSWYDSAKPVKVKITKCQNQS
jgi:hypothetical protein